MSASPLRSDTWRALSREAEVAAEHLAIGATSLGRANYAQQAYYGQAFFALSTGIERSCKLALVVDHAIEHGGRFPGERSVRAYGHSLKRLLDDVDAMAERRGLTAPDGRLPRDPIHVGIVGTLSKFAENVTRYYNLDVVTQATGVAVLEDPVAEWAMAVTGPILAQHYTERQRLRDEDNARAVHALIDDFSRVQFATEAGQVLDRTYDAALETAKAARAKPWERLYALQIARFLASVMGDLAFAAHTKRMAEIPYLSEFYVIFGNPDGYLRSRKTWSIYRP